MNATISDTGSTTCQSFARLPCFRSFAHCGSHSEPRSSAEYAFWAEPLRVPDPAASLLPSCIAPLFFCRCFKHNIAYSRRYCRIKFCRCGNGIVYMPQCNLHGIFPFVRRFSHKHFKSIIPTEYISLSVPTSSPFACSGEI